MSIFGEEREIQRSGSVEADIFVINDIVLLLSPEQIQVSKQAYNFTWQTLRTASSRKAKSGHSVIHVGLNITFKGKDIENKLIPLIAGLRATPFASVHNRYLEDLLMSKDVEDASRTSVDTSGFKSLVLALSSAVISTGGHANLVDCIQVQLQFIFFNYLPFTPIWAYKTGGTYDRPGYAWQSDVWREFYKPFVTGTLPADFPHLPGSIPPTQFIWREYMLVSSANQLAIEGTIDLLEMLLKNPEDVLTKARLLLAKGDQPQLSASFLDTLLRSVGSTEINPNEAIKKHIKDNTLPAISGVAEGTAGPIIQRLLRKSYDDIEVAARLAKTTEAKEIKDTIALLKARKVTAARATSEGYEDATKLDGDYTKLQTIEAKYGSSTKVGEVVLLGRKRRWSIDPDTRKDQDKSIIEQITVSFSNTLAVIPMAGYTYPTCQHIGSLDINATFVMNTTNADAERVNYMYDSVESNALRFRQVPAGFLNLIVRNDFLTLFNIEEFIISGVQTSTIPDQPGRSQIVLSLTEAGITSKTSLSDPEQLKQEYVHTSKSMQEEIWKIVDKYVQPLGVGVVRLGNPHTLYTTTVDKTIRATEPEAYKLIVQGVAATKDKRALISVCSRAADNYNEWLAQVHKLIFDSAPSKGGLYYATLKTLASDTKYSFIPGLDKILDSIAQRDNAQIAQRGDRSKTVSGYSAMSGDLIKKKKAYAEAQKKYGSQEVAADAVAKTKGIITDRQMKINELQLNRYLLKQHALLREIQDKYIDLPEFESLEKLKKSLGLEEGLMAYPDFKAQIRSVAGLIGNIDSEGLLTEIDPDVYMWYPLYNGMATIDSIIDVETIAAAKKYSKQSFQNAQGSVDSFFQKTYLSTIKGLDAQAPYEKLIELTKDENHPGTLSRPYYENLSYDCATNTEQLTKQKLIDPEQKTHIHIPTQNALLKTPNSCTHTTDFSALWDGVSQGANPSPTSSSPDISGKNKHSGPTTSSMKGKGVEPNYTVNWDTIPDANPKDSVNGLFCPLEGYKKLQVSGAVAMRDIGMSPSGDAWKYRPKASKVDWPELQSLGDPKKAAGWRNPAEVEQKYKKSMTSITYEEYMDWKVSKRLAKVTTKNGRKSYQDTGKGVGYLHKGVDVRCQLGTPIYAISDGTVTEAKYFPGAGVTVSVKHNGSNIGLSRYLHLQAIHPRVKRGSSVRAGQVIAIAGHSGGAMRVHLHFETWASQSYYGPGRKLLDPTKQSTGIPWNKQSYSNIKRYKPVGQSKAKLQQNITQQLSTDITTTMSSPMMKSIQELESEMLRGQAQSLMRAYPTFKLYFIEDDRGERKRLAYDDFFSYNAVKSIRVIRSRKIAADLCEIYLTNVSGILSNRKYQHERNPDEPRDAKGNKVKETNDPSSADTVKENPIASLLLQEGMNISLRLGFSSNPSKLDTVFNGVITEIEFSDSEDLVRLVAQSYAIELVQDIKGLEKPQEKKSWGLWGWDVWGFGDNASTSRILEELLSEPEVLHFGRWKPGEPGTSQRDLLTTKWQFEPNPADDNIFCPPVATDLELGTGLIIKSLKYTIYKTTIWDICKEMEMRHPNFVAAPVPYKDLNGERMTFFFGLPNQLYFARHPTSEESRAQDKLKQLQEDIQTEIDNKTGLVGQAAKLGAHHIKTVNKPIQGTVSWFCRLAYGERMGKEVASIVNKIPVTGLEPIVEATNKAKSIVDKSIRQQRLNLALEAGFIQPFRKYHLLTSGQHIISNNIKANARDVANTIVVQYPEEVAEINKKAFGLEPTIKIDEASFTLKLDNALPPEEIRTQVGSFINVQGKELAKRYALSMLLDNVKDIYKGSVTIIGNGAVKPRDVCVILDSYSDMTGPIEVEEVIHTFSQEEGFRTEIKPDMLACAAEWSLMSSSEAMAMIMEGLVQKIDGSPVHFSPMANIIGRGLGHYGGFFVNKILSYTQLAQPIVMAPLMLHGRVFTGGVPTRKLPGSVWETMFGEWNNVSDVGYSSWLEDKKDELINWVKRKTGQYRVGDFLGSE